MIYLNPIEQTISSVTLNSITTFDRNSNIKDHFINVITRNTPEAINSFKIDGVAAGNFVEHPANNKYAYAQISVNQFSHTLTCDFGFNAIAYGYGNVESYGYSAGTNLRDLYQFISIQNEYATENFPSGCKDSPFRFSINLPYKADRLQWIFGGLFKDTLIVAPVADSTWSVDDRILYRYQLKRTHVINTVGHYPITVIANNPVSDGCSGEQIIDYDLEVFDRHKAGFTSVGSGCLNAAFTFMDTSRADGRDVIRWFWDFGDGTGESIKAPEHAYLNPGSYTVRLATISDIGCISDTANASIVLAPAPDADFTLSDSACENSLLHFAPKGQGLTSFEWEFGDGASSEEPAPVHTYNSVGTFNVSLNVTDGRGCKDSLTLPVRISHLPVADFVLPQSCMINAPVTFFDSSQIADNSEDLFTYRWRFGDRRATPENPDSSNLKDPQHIYLAAGDYDVSLQVTSKNGCVSDTVKRFSHYASLPTAAFDLNFPTTVCGDTDVTVIDRSTIASGKITKVEIYWDHANDTLIKTVDLSPEAGKHYSFKYPGANSPLPRQFEVVLYAYAGAECFQLVTRTITVSPALKLEFDPLDPLCETDAPFKITGVREVGGVPGSGSFSGPGVSQDGFFDPAIAQAGLHRLRYTYSVTNGCSSYVEQTIQVLPGPFADAGPDIMVSEGGSAMLQARGTGNGSYSWTPNISIDNHDVLNPRVFPSQDITYYLKIVSTEGCSAIDSVVVRIQKSIEVPNAFSPNGDGINDTWKILNLSSYVDASVKVFNRHGQLVFQSSGYSKEWNGQYKGAVLPMGTYYYIINFRDGRRPVSGSVTILR